MRVPQALGSLAAAARGAAYRAPQKNHDDGKRRHQPVHRPGDPVVAQRRIGSSGGGPGPPSAARADSAPPRGAKTRPDPPPPPATPQPRPAPPRANTPASPPPPARLRV